VPAAAATATNAFAALVHPQLASQSPAMTGQTAVDTDIMRLDTVASLEQPYSTLLRNTSLADQQPPSDLPDLLDILDDISSLRHLSLQHLQDQWSLHQQQERRQTIANMLVDIDTAVSRPHPSWADKLRGTARHAGPNTVRPPSPPTTTTTTTPTP
jgi:hypothetical protein